MSRDVLTFCFGVHNHQPIGNFDHVITEAVECGYRPFLERVAARPEVRLTAHFTGSLLEWLRERTPATFDLLGRVVAAGQVELLTGGFYEPILAILPDHDKRAQIGRLTDYIQRQFGVTPRGMWLAERVWEPHLPLAIRSAGVEYALVDDSHFALAGLDPEALGGYYLTEEQGAIVAVFPINQRLRYLIPFADVDESVRYLESRCGRVSAITVVDDGEKFGVWPGTHDHVYGDGWLDRFFDRVLATSWLRMATFADVIDGTRATDRIYLPTASYREMGEWALATPAGRRLVAARRALAQCSDGSEFQDLLPGGFWRSFLVKYPEIGDTYWKMLRLSEALQREAGQRPGDERLDQARTQLLRGQANDAYWHGVFGGCYLPHLRRAVKQSLLAAERLLADTSAAPAVAWTRGDVNGDGREEILIRTPALAVTLNPALGGAVTELGAFEYGLDLADVLARRPETYHDRLRARTGETGTGGGVHTIHEPPTAKETGLEAFLEYDDLRRASLLDGLFEGEEPLDPVAPWRAARVVLGRMALAASVQAEDGGVTTRFTLPAGAAAPFRVVKRVRVRDADVEARYTVSGTEAAPAGRRRWAVQWNLALTSGDGAGRYFDLPGRPPLRSRGQRSDLDGVTLVDEWLGLEARLQWRPAAEVRWGPVETVSISEAGFERIYQGTAFLIVWALPAVSSGEWEMATALGVRPR